jgi:hypothetical protein
VHDQTDARGEDLQLALELARRREEHEDQADVGAVGGVATVTALRSG